MNAASWFEEAFKPALKTPRTPLTYYGGKQLLASRIIKLLPEHEGYVEPFCGGAAVFWRKLPSKWEVLNDSNRELINFYRQARNNFEALEKEVRVSLQQSRDIQGRPGHLCPARTAQPRQESMGSMDAR